MRAIGLVGGTRHTLSVDAEVVAKFEVKVHAAHAIRPRDAGNLLGCRYRVVVASGFMRRHRAEFAVTVKKSDVRLLP